jgi:chromosome segregation ATPase
LNLIPIAKFTNIYLNQLRDSYNLEIALDLIDLINEFHEIMEKNIDIISQYNEIIELIILRVKIIFLLKQKEELLKELEITEEYQKSSDIAALSDLLEKIYESINDNKKKLKYLEEDYFQRKNQIDQLSSTIKNFKQEIQNLTKKKKDCFSQINRITREMSGDPIKEKDEVSSTPEIDDKLTNAQKIKALQTNAKEIQGNINKLNKKVEQTSLKFKEINPVYEIYKNDYENLKITIESDKKKVRDLELELKTKILKNEENIMHDVEDVYLKYVRSIEEVRDAIKKNKDEIEMISVPDDISDLQNPNDLSELIRKLMNFKDNLLKNQKKIKISKKKEDINQIFGSFQNLENIINDLEVLINKLLAPVNLKAKFRILLSKDNKKFFIQTRFTRNNKEEMQFEELTTPEKIFFIVVYYIALEIQFENPNIIFSNLFIPSIYNKAGSIFRTIRKIIPLFDTDEFLSKFNLIFILSNLDMKKELKNVKIITIPQNE